MALSVAEAKLAEAMWGRYKRTAEDVIADVARLFQIDVADMTGRNRRPLFVDARAVVALILHRRGYTLTEIGHCLGYSDHSSIGGLIHRIEADSELRSLADGLVA